VLGAYMAAIEGVGDDGKLPAGAESISSLEKIDDRTVRFRTKNVADPNMLYEQLGSKVYILPKHRLENIPKAEIVKDSFTQNPDVTSGPFTFVKYEKDQYVQLKKNPDYYLGNPKIDNVYIKILSAANLVAELQTGGIHMNFLGSIAKIAVQDYDLVESMDHINSHYEETLNFQTVMFNHETLSDVRVRQAIAYAVDRKFIVDELLKGTGVIINSPYTPINNYSNPNVPVYDYNPEKAKQLLAEAGWDENRVLNYVVPTGNSIREQAAAIIVENLKAVGIKANITTLDFPTTMERARSGNYDLLSMGFTFTYDPDYTSLFGKGQTYNFMRYDSPRNEELLLQGKTEADPAKRKAIYDELQVLWQNELPLLLLYSDTDMIAVSKDVVYGGPKTYGTFADLHLWELK
jgi:peptide/nickel transport system substrate-binding protein